MLGAVSGGVDSTVAAALMARAIGPRFHALLVDNGLLRKDERVQVIKRLRDELGVNLRAVDASERFLSKLRGVSDPEAKRKIIGHEFIHVFQEEAAAMGAEFEYLLQGTLYPDVIESISFKVRGGGWSGGRHDHSPYVRVRGGGMGHDPPLLYPHRAPLQPSSRTTTWAAS